MKQKKYIKSEFDLLKQIMIDLGNINSTLALMNINKLFPSTAVKKSINVFYNDRKEFIGEKLNLQSKPKG